MQGRIDSAARTVVLATATALALLVSGCGGGGELRDANAPDASAGAHVVDTAALSHQFGRNVPLVFVDRKKGGGYEYHLQDQPYDERELLALFRSIVENDPDVEVGVVPSGVLTRDEIGLMEAKLREAGVTRIRVADVNR
jgi:hypothetical protein